MHIKNLLRWRSSGKPCDSSEPAFPARQMFVLALCRLGEPIAFMSIFPYIYYMILSFKISDDERKVAVFAGMVTSAFAFAEFSASTFWGRLSDRVGRKPILLTGLAGTGLSMLVFGFAKSLPVAIVARALGGVLNGSIIEFPLTERSNIGVLNTAVAEVVTVEKHKARGFTIMPFVWCLGSIIGAGIGGTLAEPVKNFPTFFTAGGVFDEYPFLLPNLVCTGIVVLGLVVGLLFLEETHQDKKDRRDYGRELGQRLLATILKAASPACIESGNLDEKEILLIDEKQPRVSIAETDYDLNVHIESSRSSISDVSTVCESTCSALTSASEETACGDLCDAPSPVSKIACGDAVDAPTLAEKLSWRQGLNHQVILTMVAYGLLAFHTISLEQLLPVLFSMPESDTAPVLPFKFTGGLALSTKTVGLILSGQGIIQMIVTVSICPYVLNKLGPLRTFRYVLFAYPALYCLVPYLALLPEGLQFPGILFILAWKVTAQALAFPPVQLMLSAYSPSTRVLGTIMGMAASCASLARALGPLCAGAVQSQGLKGGYAGLSYWFCALVAIAGAAVSVCMKPTPKSEPVLEKNAGEP